MPQSRLQIAVSTAPEALTEEQKKLLNDSVLALSYEELTKFREAGIIVDATVDQAPVEPVIEAPKEPAAL